MAPVEKRKEVSSEKLALVVSLHEQDKTAKDIASCLSLNYHTCARLKYIHKKGGDMEVVPRSGRPKLIGSRT